MFKTDAEAMAFIVDAFAQMEAMQATIRADMADMRGTLDSIDARLADMLTIGREAPGRDR